MYHGRTLSPSPSSSLCLVEWSVGAAGQSVVFSVMTQVAAATLSSGLPDIWWKIYLFLSTSPLFSSTSLFILHFSISVSLPHPHLSDSCIVSALLGCHTEQDEKPGKQLISCANWQEGSCVSVCVSETACVGNKAWCILLCVYLLQYEHIIACVCVSICNQSEHACVLLRLGGASIYTDREKDFWLP